MTPEGAADAAGAERLIEELYGELLGTMDGVLHVVACFLDAGTLRVLRIGDASPKSAHDFFALELARARVDAILTTGAILRAEPELRCDLRSPGLRAWRREVLGLERAPRILILTTGRNFPSRHPLLDEHAIVLAPRGAVLRLPPGVELVREDAPSPRSAIALLQARGARGISIEAGPSVARELYQPLEVDELMLSIFEGDVPEAARGGAWMERTELERCFERVHHATRDEPSGRWSFSRWIGRAGRAR